MEKFIEVWKITEMRNGSVYKTEFVENRWVPIDQKAPSGFIYAPISDPSVQQFRIL